MTLKRRTRSKEVGNNFRAGYVHIDEEHLHKTGIRGCKVYLLFFITVTLTLIAVANILFTFTILITMRLGYAGVESIEMIPGRNLIRFLVDSHFEDGMLHTPGKILSLHEQELTITGMDNHEVHLTVTDANSSIMLGPYGTQIQTDRLDIIDPVTREIVFSTDYSSFKFPDQMQSIMLEKTETNRVVSDVGEDLRIKAGDNSDLIISGMEGIEASSKRVTINANQDVNINCTESVLNFDSTSGLHLTQVDSFPQVPKITISADQEEAVVNESDSDARTDDTLVGYKLCVCMPDALLYAVSAEGRCDEYQSPCVKAV